MTLPIKMRFLVSGLAFVLFSAPLLYADDSNTYINGSIGRQDFDADRALKSEELITIGIEHRYANQWAAEVFFMDSSPTLENIGTDVDLTQYGIDGIYYFKAASNNRGSERIHPYGVVGLGHADFKNSANTDKETQLRGGLGLRYLLGDHWSVKADTRLIYSAEAQSLDNSFTLGVSYAFDKQAKRTLVPVIKPLDSDGDGVIDSEDNCLDTAAGVQVNDQGCVLDSDGDGVADYADNCPTTPLNVRVDGSGCSPDSDKDGVTDYKDYCPATPSGVKVDSFGCALDSDGDGVADYQDNCPASPAGIKVNAKGCALDSDGDGVADHKDKCPATPAGREVDDRGCKFVLSSTAEVTLKINFASNSTVVTDEYMSEVEKVAKFLTKYGEVNAVIEGHTDDRGAASYNTRLSQGRADAVVKILIQRFGISSSRLSARGYGEERPIASNATKQGRLENRRVVAVMEAQN